MQKNKHFHVLLFAAIILTIIILTHFALKLAKSKVKLSPLNVDKHSFAVHVCCLSYDLTGVRLSYHFDCSQFSSTFYLTGVSETSFLTNI